MNDDFKAQLERDSAALDAAHDRDLANAFIAAHGGPAQLSDEQTKFQRWTAPLPKYVGGNLIDSALEATREHEAHSPAARQAVLAFREHTATLDDDSDAVTQAAAAFAIPFLGWRKALDSGSSEDVARTRQHAERKLVGALSEASTDDRAVNALLDYLGGDAGPESQALFESAVDALGTAPAVATLLKTSAVAMRAAHSPQDAAFERRLQEGSDDAS
ncbi:MAG: hypothetical protein ACREXP_10780 [Steroidobacteraceae bacterium]